MIDKSRILTATGVLAAIVALASACDPYQAETSASPQILGVMVVMSDALNSGVPADTATCQAPYPDPDPAKAPPGGCDIPGICPTPCFWPRTGPAWAPFFTGTLGASYACENTATNATCPSSASYTYAIPANWILVGVPAVDLDPNDDIGLGGIFLNQIRITFNKMLNAATVQPDPAELPGSCTAAPNIVVRSASPPTAAAGDVTSQFSVCYDPNSAEGYLGATISVQPRAGFLAANTRYTVVGDQVADQSGNKVNFTVTVETAP